MKKRRNKGGFTLIEMLVVLMIIGILAAVAVPRFLRKAEISRWGEAASIARSVVDAEHRYCVAQGACDNTLANVDVEVPTMRYFTGVAATDCSCNTTVGLTLNLNLTFTRSATDAYGGTSGQTAILSVNTSTGGLCARTTGTAPAWVENNLGIPAC